MKMVTMIYICNMCDKVLLEDEECRRIDLKFRRKSLFGNHLINQHVHICNECLPKVLGEKVMKELLDDAKAREEHNKEQVNDDMNEKG